MNKIYIDWELLGIIINDLVKQVKERKQKFSGVYGIPRGGLPLAVVMSHRLKLPLQIYPDEKSLVVDDISDTGKTLQAHKNKFIATLFTTDWTKTKPHCWVRRKEKETDWIVFPWENI